MNGFVISTCGGLEAIVGVICGGLKPTVSGIWGGLKIFVNDAGAGWFNIFFVVPILFCEQSPAPRYQSHFRHIEKNWFLRKQVNPFYIIVFSKIYSVKNFN